MKPTKTLDYYDKNAQTFVDGTISVDFGDVQNKFLTLLPKGGFILDFGCGSGRDTKYFLCKGYKVDAVDGSTKMCEIARCFTGLDVRQMLFSELEANQFYDGIWACSSILHLPKAELKDVIMKMIRALKSSGIIYTSFKYGDFEGYRNDRFFTDFTENSFSDFIKDFPEIKIIENWITVDVRPGRDHEKWLNLLLRKTDSI